MSREGGVVRFIINSIRRKRREFYVPADIVTEILSWLPVKSVHRFKCVCRLWCSIAQDSQFIHKHMMRATERTWAVEDQGLLKHTCQGLVFEPTTGSKSSNYRTRNPSTNRVLDLPDINEKADAFAMRLCYISRTRTFKVICPYHNGGESLSFKILTVDVDDEWRTLDLPFTSNVAKSPNSYYWAVSSFKEVYVLVMSHKTELDREVVILEVDNERVWTISIRRQGLSKCLSERMSCKHLDTVKRSMYSAVVRRWVVEDCKKRKWAKEEIVINLTRMNDYLAHRDYEPPYWFKDKGLTDMSCNDDKLLKVRCGIESGYLRIKIRKTTPGKKKYPLSWSFKGMKALLPA